MVSLLSASLSLIFGLAAQGPAQGAPGQGAPGQGAPGQGAQGQRAQQGTRQRQPGGPADAPAAAAAATAPMIDIPPSVTHHTINLPTGALSYTANAAQVPLKNETGNTGI